MEGLSVRGVRTSGGGNPYTRQPGQRTEHGSTIPHTEQPRGARLSMSTTENENKTTTSQDGEQPKGGFAKDKAFGNRLDLTFAIGEPFLLLGAIPDEPVETKFGMSDSARLLCQKINPETGAPQGAPIRCVTVASAIVEKVLSLDPSELAAGPVVRLQIVKSKARDTNALVLSWMRNLTDADDFSDFGLDAGAVARVVDQARPEGERLPKGF